MYKRSIIALCLSILAMSVTANDDKKINSVYTAAPFLTIAPDSRSSSMGDVGVATTPDVNSLYWNPAKYAFIENEESIALSYSPWLRGLVRDMNLLYLTWYKRLDDFQVIAASLRYFNMGSIQFTDEHGQHIDVRRPTEFAIDAAYSRRFSDNISSALAFRYAHSDISAGISNSPMRAKPGNSFAADLAMYYNSELFILDKSGDWAIGINMSNIGTKMSYSNEQNKMFIPTNLRIGGTFGLNMDSYNTMRFAVDFNKLLVPTPPELDENREIVRGYPRDVPVVQGIFQSFYDAPYGFKEEMREISFGVGLEYLYRKAFAVRTGYFHENRYKGNRRYFTIGIGLSMNIIDFDFSYLISTMGQNNPLNNTLRFTIIYNFRKTTIG